MLIQKNMLWFSFGSIVHLGTQWLITVLVARGTGLNDAGILSLAISVSATFQTIAQFGMRNYQISDIQERYSDSIYIQSRFITCFVASFLCGFFIIINRYQRSQSFAILFFMGFRLSDAFSDVFRAILQKRDRLDIVGKGFFYRGIVVFLFFGIGYYFFHSLNFGLLFMFIGAVLTTLFYDMKNSKQISGFKFNLKLKIECCLLLKETTPLCICVCLQSAISTIPKYILERMYNGTALGAYSSIFAPATLIQVAASYIFIPFISRFSKYYLNQETYKFKRIFLQISLCIILVAILAVLCARLIGWELLSFVFGSVISGYEYLLIPILFCTFANAIFAFCSMVSIVIRDFAGQMFSCSLGFVLCIISTLYCISMYGINGASYGLLIGIISAILVLVFRIIWIISKLECTEEQY